jgi:hypothetical protein
LRICAHIAPERLAEQFAHGAVLAHRQFLGFDQEIGRQRNRDGFSSTHTSDGLVLRLSATLTGHASPPIPCSASVATGIFYAQGVKANVLFLDRKPASETPWTKTLWIYEFRTSRHFTLKTKPLKRADLDDFLACYNPENGHERKTTERFRAFDFDELVRRDKASLDIFWLKDESLEDSANLPDPDVIALEIAEDLEAALDQFSQIAADLKA